jgi:hypothetical protein
MAFNQVITSHNRIEWWSAHLASTFSEMGLKVTNYAAAGYGERGYAAETPITQLVGPSGVGDGFYLGSIAHLLPGVAELPMTTAVWTDHILPLNELTLPCLKLFDVVFCTQKDSLNGIAATGIQNVEWMPFAYDTSLEDPAPQEKRYDIGFVGSLDQPATKDERRKILGLLEARYRLNDFRRAVYGTEMLNVYRRARIVVNVPVRGSFNMRTFEALASGALLLTKAVGNGQDELFQDGVHLVVYRDTEDLLEKVQYYLRNERERETIAANGRHEVLSRHTYRHRADQVLKRIKNAPRSRVSDLNLQAEAQMIGFDMLRRPDLIAELAFRPGLSWRTRFRLLRQSARSFARNARSARLAVDGNAKTETK